MIACMAMRLCLINHHPIMRGMATAMLKSNVMMRVPSRCTRILNLADG